jgi:hypothetical protein
VGKRAGYIDKRTGYSFIQIGLVEYLEHNLVWFYFKGTLPPAGHAIEIDHKDRNPGNNHPDNLRWSTRSQNSANSKLRKSSKTGYRGVSFSKKRGKYVAQACKDGKAKWLGYHDTALKAAKVAAAYRDQVFGEFAYHPNLDGSM